MSVFQLKTGFGPMPLVIPNGGFATMTGCEAAVYGVLVQHYNPDRGCWPSREKIAKGAGVSIRSVDLAITRLEETGKIKVDRGGGRGHSNRYWLMEEKGAASCALSEDERAQSEASKGCNPVRERAQSGTPKGATGCAPTERTEGTDNNRGDAVADLLTDRGVKPPELAGELAAKYLPERIEEVCKACDLTKPSNPGGWIRKALKDGYDVGDDVRESLRKARDAEKRDQAVERFRAMTPAEHEPIITEVQAKYPNLAGKMRSTMTPDELLAVPAFRGALYQVVRG